MPDGYTNEEVSGYVSQFLSEKLRVDITKTGRRDVDGAWETLYANLTNALMMDPDAYFYLVWLASNKARALAQDLLDTTNAVIAAASVSSRQAVPLETGDLSQLVNAEAALLNVDAALGENTAGISGSLGPQIRRFQDSVTKFVRGNLGPNVIRSKSFVKTRDEVASDVESLWSDAATQDVELEELLERLQSALSDFSGLRLGTTAVGRMIRRVRDRVSSLQTEVVGRDGLKAQRPAAVELLTAAELVNKASSFQLPGRLRAPEIGETGEASFVVGNNETAEAISSLLGAYTPAADTTFDFTLDGTPYSVPVLAPKCQLLLDLNGWTSGTLLGGLEWLLTIALVPYDSGIITDEAHGAISQSWTDLDDLVNYLNTEFSVITASVYDDKILLEADNVLTMTHRIASSTLRARGAEAFNGAALGYDAGDLLSGGPVAALPAQWQSVDDATTVAERLVQLGIDAEAAVVRYGAGIGMQVQNSTLVLGTTGGDNLYGELGDTVLKAGAPISTDLTGLKLHFAQQASDVYTVVSNTEFEIVVTPALTADRSGQWAAGPDASGYLGEVFLYSGAPVAQSDLGVSFGWIPGARLGFTHLYGAAVQIDTNLRSYSGPVTWAVESRVLQLSHDLTAEDSSMVVTSGVDVGIANGPVYPSTVRVRLTEDVGGRGAEAGDLIDLYFGGTLIHSAEVTAVAADLITFDPAYSGDLSAAVKYELRNGHYARFEAMLENMAWDSLFGAADSAVQRLVSGARYAAGVQTALEEYRDELTTLIDVLDDYAIRRFPAIIRLIRMFREQGFDRALDMLTSLRLNELLRLSAEGVSYRTQLVRKIADTTREIAPVHRYAKSEIVQPEVGNARLVDDPFENPKERDRRNSR